MKIEDHQQWLEREIAGVRITAPPDTPLGEAGATACSMVRAYTEDGGGFLATGDAVNGVASFGYAEGWLDAARALGFVVRGSQVPTEPLEPLQGDTDRLTEKTERYHRLLQEGLSALEPASDSRSILWKSARHVLEEARSALEKGEEQIPSGSMAEALRLYSYGHGLLDAGVRSGIFRITGNRDLFTI